MRFILILAALFVLAVAGGCSFSRSSESISDSISKSSESIADSSKSSSNSISGDEDSGEPAEDPQDAASYEADIAQLASTYAKTGGDIGALRSAVSQVAVKRGITNWEADPKTIQGIGRGVGEGGMTEEQFANFSNRLFGEDLSKKSELLKGFQQAASGSS